MDQLSSDESIAQPHFTEETGIRVTCCNFVRVIAPGEHFADGEPRYLLLLNRSSLFRGTAGNNGQPELVFTPIGGGTEFTPKGMSEVQVRLMNLGGIEFEYGADMRVRIANASQALVTFLEIFQTEGDAYRERIGSRELDEEMGEETGLLSDEDLARITLSRKPTVHEDIVSTLRGTWRGKTHLYAEVYDAHIPSDLLHRLIRIANDPTVAHYHAHEFINRSLAYYTGRVEQRKLYDAMLLLFKRHCLLRFVTKGEILQGQTDDGIKIAPATNALLA